MLPTANPPISRYAIRPKYCDAISVNRAFVAPEYAGYPGKAQRIDDIVTSGDDARRSGLSGIRKVEPVIVGRRKPDDQRRTVEIGTRLLLGIQQELQWNRCPFDRDPGAIDELLIDEDLTVPRDRRMCRAPRQMALHRVSTGG